MNSSSNSSDNDLNSFESDYMTSLYRFVLYDGLRILQMIVGIIGNGMTLHIIRNLKILKNGHILMAYLAVSDIAINSVVPLETFTNFTSEKNYTFWKTLCICKDWVYLTASGFSYACYFILSIDR